MGLPTNIRPIVFVINGPLTNRINLADADRINIITGAKHSDVETLILDMVCCHLVAGDPNTVDYDIDSQYMEWLMEVDDPLTDGDLADATHHYVNIHMRIYRPILFQHMDKLDRMEGESYDYRWQHIDDDRAVALVFTHGDEDHDG